MLQALSDNAHDQYNRTHVNRCIQEQAVVQLVSDISGLHATSSTTPYLPLFARSRHFEREHLDDELYVKRTLGKIRCVRKTIYILTADLISIAYRATANMVVEESRRYLAYWGVSRAKYEKVSRRIMTAIEIKKSLKTQTDVATILYLMCNRGLLIRGQPDKGWTDKNHRYARFSDYFPDMSLEPGDENEALARWVQQYVQSCGRSPKMTSPGGRASARRRCGLH